MTRSEDLKSNARGFKLAAERAMELRPVEGTSDMFVSALIPAIVCLAFSAELYLKYLIGKDDMKGHKLDFLFKQLPDEVRAKLYEKLIDKTELTKSDIDSKLEQSGNAFIKWRYWHEDKSKLDANIEWMRNLVETLGNEAEN